MSARPKIGVVTFPGSLDDRDADWALGAVGARTVSIWHADHELPDVAGIVLPGGFSYGDYLRAGAIASRSPIMQAVTRFAADGGLVLGICNGFQILCEAGLLPGALLPNASLSFVCRDADLIVGGSRTAFLSRCEPGSRLTIPVKHGEGRWYANEELYRELADNGQIALTYEGESPSGSLGNVAGICNAAGNVFGLMPHPEHAVDPLLGSGDGALILASMVDAARAGVPAAV